MNEIYFATNNKMKFQEAENYFKKYLPHVNLKQCDKDFDEIQTYDQKIIALNKAVQAWNYLKKPVFTDDAGIYFEKYQNFPGTLTKFIYKGIGLEGILKLVNPNDKATFKLTLAFIHEQNSYQFFDGICNGKIIHPETLEVLNPTVPFDMIFVPDGQEKTFNELRYKGRLEEFNYRAYALKQIVEWIKVNLHD